MKKFLLTEEQLNFIVNSLKEVPIKYVYSVYKLLESLNAHNDPYKCEEVD